MTRFSRMGLAGATVLALALPAVAQREIQKPRGTWQQPGEIQKPRDTWQPPGEIQVPKGIQVLGDN